MINKDLNYKYKKIIFIWKNDNVIGYCHTIKEADDICKIKTELSWSVSKKIFNEYTKKYDFLTINDFQVIK